MAITRGLGTTGNAAGTVTPLDHKLAQSGLLAKQGAGSNLIRPGLFYDGTVNIVTGTSGMSYNVAPFTAALSRGAAAGTVLLCNDGTVNVVTTAAPGSNSRIDIVYAWQREFSLDGVNSNPVIGVVQGSPAAVPVAPSLAAFPGAIELARITVPAGVTATNSGPTITQSTRFTASAGGTLYFRTAAELNEALNLVPDGTMGFVETTDTVFYHADGAWLSLDQLHSRRQLDTTNDAGRFLVQHGAGRIVGNNGASVNETVTFPVAFASTPIVLVSHPGYRNTGAFNLAGLTAGSSVIATSANASTTAFDIYLRPFTGTLANTIDWYYTWMAIGVAA